MASLKLVSINIEYSKHLDTVGSFLSAQMPDVVCIQELQETDINIIADSFGATHHVFAPMTRQTHNGRANLVGLGIFSRTPIESNSVQFYTELQELPESNTSDPATYNSKLCPVLFCDIRIEAELFRIGTTHFTWTPDGNASDAQREDIQALLRILGSHDEFVLTGDFNAPRGGEIFAQLTQKYKDNIPAQYTSSLDPNLHRAGKLNLMVDGIFSTPRYQVSDVELHSGVSDHCAITARVIA